MICVPRRLPTFGPVLHFEFNETLIQMLKRLLYLSRPILFCVIKETAGKKENM